MLTLQGDTLTNNYNLWITLFSIGKILKLVGDTSQPWSIFIILFPLDLMIFKPLLGQQTRNYNSLTNWFFIDELFGYIILKCIYVPLVWINKQWLTHSCKSVSIIFRVRGRFTGVSILWPLYKRFLQTCRCYSRSCTLFVNGEGIPKHQSIIIPGLLFPWRFNTTCRFIWMNQETKHG